MPFSLKRVSESGNTYFYGDPLKERPKRRSKLGMQLTEI